MLERLWQLIANLVVPDWAAGLSMPPADRAACVAHARAERMTDHPSVTEAPRHRHLTVVPDA